MKIIETYDVCTAGPPHGAKNTTLDLCPGWLSLVEPCCGQVRRLARASLSLGLGGAFLLAAGLLSGADWPQYRGPNGDGVSPEKMLLKWPTAGPRQIWKTPTPDGFSSFAVSGGRAFTLVVRTVEGAPREGCVALNADTGKELWMANLAAGKYDGSGNAGTPDNKGGDGPRCTPTVSDGKVYVFTPGLVLFCLDAATGQTVWSKDLVREHAGRNIGWKNAASAVVDGELVYVAGGGPGQSLLGLNKVNGQVVWQAHDELITHATPIVATIHGMRQVIFFLQKGLLSVNAQTGARLWHFPFRYNVSTAISPIVAGDLVYCSAGYDVGSGVCRIVKSGAGFSANEVWKIPGNKPVANHWSTPVHKDGFLYGMFSFKNYGAGPLKCVELATGQVKWEKPGFGAGNVILADGHLLALADTGQVAVVEATPAGYKEVARAKAVNGKCWSTPSLSRGRLYVRSTKEGACLDVAPQTAAP